MYETFYNLRAEPFRLSPDHRFCYEHKGYAKARAYMAYAFMRAEGFVMVTGRPGTGKTTLIGDLIESLAKDNVTTANLVCTQLQADDLLKTVAYSFGVGADGVDKAELLQRLNVLFHNWHREGQRALLIVDEAQDLSTTAMEELRLLTNIQIDGQPLLQIFLLGQPELRDLILSPQMEQVHQRIVAASHLEALELEETEAYVRHRLETVGWRGDPAISKAVFPLIHKFSEGVPRRINLICSRLFLHGGVEQRHEIGVQDVRAVIGELQGENLAAGNKFSEGDFAAEDEFEQVVTMAEPSQEQEQERAPVGLYAVGDAPVAVPGNKPVTDPSESKKKELPVIVPPPEVVAPESPADDVIALNQVLPEGDQDKVAVDEEQLRAGEEVKTADSAPLERAPTYSEPAVSSNPTNTPGKSQTGAQQGPAKGAGVRSILVISIFGLLLLLIFILVGQGSWDDWQGKLQSLRDKNFVTESATEGSAVDPVVGGAAAKAPAPLAIKPGKEAPVDASFSEPVEEPIARQELQKEIIEQPSHLVAAEDSETQLNNVSDTFANVQVPEAEVLVDDGGFADLPAQDSDDQPQESVALLELDQILVVSFAFDSVVISPDFQVVLDEKVVVMRQWPMVTAHITGFSDGQGEENYNLELSRKRAMAVEKYFVNKGVERHRLYVDWKGSRDSYVAEKATAAALASDLRRVVLIRMSSEASGDG